MRYNIQNVILPNPVVCDEERMYFRRRGSLVQERDNILFQKNAVCDFSTYFNSFSLNKWLEYTKLSNLHLSLSLKGDFIVKIYSAYWFCNDVVQECLSEDIIHAENKEEYTFDIDISHNDSIYFKLIALSDDAVLYDGAYYTNISKELLNKVDIDLVMCTFKREKYVTRNIDLIVNNFIKAEGYNGSEHFRIKVVDNGQTLPVEKMRIPGLVELYPNINVGGSGGFARGMIESLHDECSTHILFMDDDVLVQVEAFEKTYNFLSLLKDEYNKAFLGGAMLRLDKKNIQHENLAGFKANYLTGLKSNLNLNHYKSVLFNEKTEKIENIYCAWWYCCIPKTVANLNNLPYPFFVRMDDVEYSIRNITHAISLNGINVWHEGFNKKYSTLMENYFSMRNQLVADMLHNAGNKKIIFNFLGRRFVHDIFRYDYNGAELLLDGIDNVLKGPEFFKNVDTIKDLQQHGKKQLKLQPLKNLQNGDMLYQDYKVDLEKGKETTFTKYIRFVTWNGHLLPNIFFKNQGFAEYGYGNNSKMYFKRKKVLAFNTNFDAGIILSIQRKRALNLTVRCLGSFLKLIINYNSLKKDYQQAFKDMTSEPFWHKYLKL